VAAAALPSAAGRQANWGRRDDDGEEYPERDKKGDEASEAERSRPPPPPPPPFSMASGGSGMAEAALSSAVGGQANWDSA